MGTHEQQNSVPAGISDAHWFKRHRWLTYLALGILGYFLLIEHRQHVFQFLPFALLGVCLLMHGLMHGGHKHGGHKRPEKEPSQ